jgi:predicted porin
MNKKLIALAVAGACVAPTVMAQSANPVTLYGRIFISVEAVEADGGAPGTDLASRFRMEDQSSYLGVRGSEDLGGGLKAIFQLETGFDPQQNQTSYATRNSMVGLQGNWGTAFVGRWDTPMKTTITAVDPWGDLTSGDITGANLDQGNFSRRMQNNFQYWSPNWSGFNFRFSWTPNEGKTSDNPATAADESRNPEMYGASLVYSKGPLYLAYAYEQHKDFINAAGAAGAKGKEEGNALAARYAFGNFRLMGSYGEYKKSNLPKDKSYMLGADWKIGGGKHVLLGSFQNAEAGAADCDMFSLGYRYDFSKRTFFYTSYTEVDNSNGMNCNFGSGSFGSVGQDLKNFGAGVRHLF